MSGAKDAAPGEKQCDERNTDEDRTVRLQRGQVADPGARDAERDQHEGPRQQADARMAATPPVANAPRPFLGSDMTFSFRGFA